MNRPAGSSSRRRINFENSMINLYKLSPMVEFLYNDPNSKYVNNLNLNRSESLDFIHIIENQFSLHEIVKVDFQTDNKYSKTQFRVIDKILYITSKSERSAKLYFKLHVNAIKNLRHITHVIENIQLSFIFEFFPVVLTLKMKNDIIIQTQLFFSSSYDKLLFKILTNYHTFKYDKRLYEKIATYVKDNQAVNANEIQFSFKLSDEELHSVIADLLLKGTILLDTLSGKLRFRDPFKFQSNENSENTEKTDDFIKLAAAMSDLFIDYIQITRKNESKNYTVTGFKFNPSIVLNERNYVVEMDCNCDSKTKKRACYHIFALHTSMIRGGLT